MSIRPGYSQLYYDVEKSDTLYYFSINTDNRFDNPIYFAIGYGKSSAILSVKELIEFAEQGNKGEETISVPGLYTEPFKLQLKMVGSKYCVEYYFYNEDNLPVQSFAFVIATSDEEAIQKAQNYSTSKITIISCTKYA